MWNKNYEIWKNAQLPKNLHNELENLEDEEIKDAFYQDISFGTAGLRGIMGVGTNRINEIIIKKITKGFGNYLINNNLTGGVAIAYDNRINSKEFAFIAARVLAALNIKTYIYPELRPTPMLSFAVRHFKTSGGIMITASHNPKEYNGYKVYNKHGGQVGLEDSEKIIKEISLIDDIFNIDEIDNDLINLIDLEEIDTIYLNKVKGITINNFKSKATILFSPLHGTAGTVVPKLMKEDNYDFHAYEPHMIFDGNFPNIKSANPEEKIAYDDLIAYAKEINADIITLTDPDADRLGVAVKSNDSYEILNGNQTAVIILYYLLTQKVKNNIDIENGYVFTSNVTSDLIIDIAKDYNLNVVVTLSGFKFIAEAITEIPNNYPYIYGCEESNGNIISDFVRDKDAVQAVYMFAEIASFLKNNNLNFIDYLEEIYSKYGYYLELTKSYTFKGIKGKHAMNSILMNLRKNALEIPFANLIDIEDNLKQSIYDLKTKSIKASSLPKADVLKYRYDDNSWIIVRPSGTEPKLKIYFSVKGNSLNDSRVKLYRIIKFIDNKLSL
ncbi:MAG TPA: phospho-sugar mutase [Acholeplasmataceae bacterium]|nr:phospho-sugar mutase [Acholeplasmataceae bacterium]